jgi:cold-inducible RNA-binding protein
LPAFDFQGKEGSFMNIFVGNLSFKTSEEDLQKAFAAFGEVRSVKIVTDHNTLKSRGFAFVEMQDRDQALAAIAGINGKELAGQILKVNEAKPREAHGGQSRGHSGGGFASGARSSGGGGNRDRSSGGHDNKDLNGSIYDSKDRGGGGGGRRGRGGRGSGSGGRSGGDRRSH